MAERKNDVLICSLILTKFHHYVDELKKIFYKNGCPLDLVEKFMKELLDKILALNVLVSTVPQ